MTYAPVPVSDRPPQRPTRIAWVQIRLTEFKQHMEQRPEHAFVLIFVTLFILGMGSFVLYMVTGDFQDTRGTLGSTLDNVWSDEARRFEAYLKPLVERLDDLAVRLDRIEAKLNS